MGHLCKCAVFVKLEFKSELLRAPEGHEVQIQRPLKANTITALLRSSFLSLPAGHSQRCLLRCSLEGVLWSLFSPPVLWLKKDTFVRLTHWVNGRDEALLRLSSVLVPDLVLHPPVRGIFTIYRKTAGSIVSYVIAFLVQEEARSPSGNWFIKV